MKIHLPCDVINIIAALESKGHEAYIVGGCVRDSVLKQRPKDWDITTSALPDEVVGIFPKTFETGIKHGTVTVLINRCGYEITTFRIDGEYFDSRRPEQVTFTSNIIEDLSRRDFTVNAIGYNPRTGFIDPFEGQADITRKLIRCVGPPEHRFGEDALRMLRAIRFAGQLGFEVDKATLRAIADLASNITKISAERVREELTKLICSQNVHAIKLLESTGLLKHILPTYKGNIDNTIDLLKGCPVNVPLRLAVFFEYDGQESNKLLRNLRFDNKTIRETFYYICMIHHDIFHDRYEIKKILRQIAQAWDAFRTPYNSNRFCMPSSIFENLLLLKKIFYPVNEKMFSKILLEAKDILEKNECFTLADLSVTGDDLVANGIPPGKAVGEKLEELLDAVMRNPKLNKMLKTFVQNDPKPV